MAANNQGIDHIRRDGFSKPLCKNRNAHMGLTISQFRADNGEGRFCLRCVAKLAKIEAIRN